MIAIVGLSACSGSSTSKESSDASKSDGTEVSKDDDFMSASDFRDALAQKGFVCADFAVTAVADRDMFSTGAVDVATCNIEGENAEISIWKDNGQLDNYTGMVKSIGCTMAKGFGISTFDYAKGDKWSLGGVSQTLAEKLAKALDAKAVHVKC